MSDITIPPEALEAGARAIADVCCPPELFADCKHCYCRIHARACFLAMVKAWPNQHVIGDDVVYILHAIILPLPQEPSGE